MNNYELAIEQIQLHKEDSHYPIDYPQCDLAISALREKQEHEKPQPLKPKQLKDRIRKPIWVKELGGNGVSGYDIITSISNGYIETMREEHLSLKNYGKTWVAYDYPPKDIATS